MNFADKHNFGKSVEVVRRASGKWFRKPRTVFWEWLFFGKDSPLVEIFNVVGQNCDRALSSFLYNLEIEVEGNWLGYSREQKATPTDALQPSHFYGFGVLLAYTYIFGIRDLHQQNLIMTKTHLQPVDIEVVFTQLVLPSETLLLPFKTFGYEAVGIGSLAKSPRDFGQEQVRQVFAGYFDFFICAKNRKDQIAHALSDADLSSHPCRVIVRNTSEYGRHIEGKQPLEPLASEKAQLSRGDIPYYFKYLGKKDLRWLATPDQHEIEEHLGIFTEDIDRHAVSPLGLLEANLSTDQKMIQGAMQIVRHFSTEQKSVAVDLIGDISVRSFGSQITVGNRKYAAV